MRFNPFDSQLATETFVQIYLLEATWLLFIFYRSVSTSGNLWAHKAISDNQMVSCLSSKVYYGVTHPITCMATCPQNSTCDAFFYSESEAKCVTCPHPCQQASLVTASGYRYYKQQRSKCRKQMRSKHLKDSKEYLFIMTHKLQICRLCVCVITNKHSFEPFICVSVS